MIQTLSLGGNLQENTGAAMTALIKTALINWGEYKDMEVIVKEEPIVEDMEQTYLVICNFTYE